MPGPQVSLDRTPLALFLLCAAASLHTPRAPPPSANNKRSRTLRANYVSIVSSSSELLRSESCWFACAELREMPRPS
jgi:hypothetical protein